MCRGFLPHPATRKPSVVERIRQAIGRRGTSLLLALVAEALLILLVLTLGTSLSQREENFKGAEIVRFRSISSEEQEQAQTETPDNPSQPTFAQTQTQPEDRPDTPPPSDVQTPPQERPTQMIELSTRDLAAADISSVPRRAPPAPPVNRGMMGPVDTGSSYSDTPRVSGSGPNGEPLYAASWYREPTDGELAGYLSTATGPGWGLIACRTAPGYRVEDCIRISEYPAGSNIARSVLAAAWQFRVRPPRVGGEPKIGEWVRIRIDYEVRR